MAIDKPHLIKSLTFVFFFHSFLFFLHLWYPYMIVVWQIFQLWNLAYLNQTNQPIVRTIVTAYKYVKIFIFRNKICKTIDRYIRTVSIINNKKWKQLRNQEKPCFSTIQNLKSNKLEIKIWTYVWVFTILLSEDVRIKWYVAFYVQLTFV